MPPNGALDKNPKTYTLPANLLARHLLKYVKDSVLRPQLPIRKYHLVQRARIRNNPRDILCNIRSMRQREADISTAYDVVERIRHLCLYTARRQLRETQLVKPADIDNCVRDVEKLDVIKHFFFLLVAERSKRQRLDSTCM